MALKVGETVQVQNLNEVIVSDPEQEVFEFMWSLKKFAAVLQNSTVIMSPSFTSPTTQTEWRVNVRKESSGFKNRLHVGLRFASSPSAFPVKTAYFFQFLNSEHKVLKGPSNRNHSFTRNDELHEVCVDDEKSFANLSGGYLAVDGSLNLLFRVTTTQYNPNYVKCEQLKPPILATMNKETFNSLLENGKFSDLTVETKTNSFPASKMILAVQSPVFNAMFLSEMLESKENVVKIEDFSDETVKMFLEFLYTGQCESLAENVMELLKISDKYEAANLKRECEKELIKTLSKENAADLLILASFYNSTLLKSKVTSFVKRCRKQVAETESFKQLKKLHPEILLDLYAEFD